MERSSLSPSEAQAALDSAAAVRAKIAEVGVCPPWRHAAFGAVMSLLIFGAGEPLAWQTASLVIAMGLVALIVSWDRRRYGVFVNGYRKGKTRRAIALLVVGLAGLLVWQIHLREEHAAAWVPFAIAGLTFCFATAGSVWWASLFRQEMGA
jgi:hypothetical protein